MESSQPTSISAGRFHWRTPVQAIPAGLGRLLATSIAYGLFWRNQRQRARAEIAQHEHAGQALRESEERYRLVVDHVIESILVLQDRVVKYANPRATAFSGYTLDELGALPFIEIVHAEDRPMVLDRHQQRLAGESVPPVYEFRVVTKAGDVKWVEIRASRITWQGRPATLSLLNDITARKQTEQALARERHLMRALLDNLPDAIYFKDAQSRFTSLNKAAAAKHGLSDPGQLVGKTDFDFYTPEHAQPAWDDEQEIMRTGQPIVAKEELETRPGGPPTWVYTTKMPLRDESGAIVGTFGISRDITAFKQAQERLLYLSIHDALTGLYNRAYFEDVLAQLSQGNPYPISVVVVDIDGMKRTNDTLGHAAGDDLLRCTADLLRAACRKGDDVARIGGDEFAILLPRTPSEDVAGLVARLRQALAEHNGRVAGPALSLSMGAATAYESGRLAQTITNADQAMYRDKQGRRGLLGRPGDEAESKENH